MSSSEIAPLRHTGLHSYHRRAISHDYYAPFIYHIILQKAAGCEPFGSVAGDARIAPDCPGCAAIKESRLGKFIAKSILHLPYELPIIKLYQFCVMPDHVHILLQVTYRSDKHLDYYIDSLLERILGLYAQETGRKVNAEHIFTPGYCDKPLYDDRNLDGQFRYIRENPHRLAMRRQFPQFFQRARRLNIAGGVYEAYGNMFFLRNPDKEAVKISRNFSKEQRAELKHKWLMAAAKGTVLVSPFISPAEREIRTEAEALGANIILLVHEAFGERYKPARHDFELCSQGRLLIISYGLPQGSELTRPVCLQMNALAQSLSAS